MIQLCNGPYAVLFRTHKLWQRHPHLENRFVLPPELLAVLRHPNIVKVGVALRDDAKRLMIECPGSFITPIEDIHEMPLYHRTFPKSLLALTAIYLGVRIDKGKKVRLSNWATTKKLTERQIQYAATDAWASLAVYERMRELQALHHLY